MAHTTHQQNKIEQATKTLRNAPVRVVDKRDTDEGVSDELFELTSRALTDALQGYPVEAVDVKIVSYPLEASREEQTDACEIFIQSESTPNILNFLANTYQGISFMGAMTPGRALQQQHTLSSEIRAGNLCCRYRFSEAGNLSEILADADDPEETALHLPQLE